MKDQFIHNNESIVTHETAPNSEASFGNLQPVSDVNYEPILNVITRYRSLSTPLMIDIASIHRFGRMIY